MPANKYFLKSGERVVGTTTVCNQLGKGDGIPNWSHKIAYDSTVRLIKEYYTEFDSLVIPKYEDIQRWQGVRDSAGDIGTLVHEMVMNYWTGEEVRLKDYTSEQRGLASDCTEKFFDWEDIDNIEPILVEIPLVSEVYKFGGQPDLYAKVNGKNRLIDIKTSGGIYDSHWLQLAAYGILLSAVRGFKVDEYQILWLPKDNRFDCPIRTDLRKEKKIFKHLLGIHQLRRAE